MVVFFFLTIKVVGMPPPTKLALPILHSCSTLTEMFIRPLGHLSNLTSQITNGLLLYTIEKHLAAPLRQSSILTYVCLASNGYRWSPRWFCILVLFPSFPDILPFMPWSISVSYVSHSYGFLLVCRCFNDTIALTWLLGEIEPGKAKMLLLSHHL